jgi:hypothetical protein
MTAYQCQERLKNVHDGGNNEIIAEEYHLLGYDAVKMILFITTAVKTSNPTK